MAVPATPALSDRETWVPLVRDSVKNADDQAYIDAISVRDQT
jgi:hypothetical protein